ncbi:MAG: hypothetical protein KDK33_17615, partial [Leptospiraceae bacterium]|nr:hypothetical protein [Leptospiraceae bacterium]
MSKEMSMRKKIWLGVGGLVAAIIIITAFWTASPLELADAADIHRLDKQTADSIDYDALTKEATVYLQDLIRMRTVRGDEDQASQYIKKVL